MSQLERLHQWMQANGYTAEQLSGELGYLLNHATSMIEGKREITNHFRTRFGRRFGEAASKWVFDRPVAHVNGSFKEMYPRQYAAHTEMRKALRRGELLPASYYKCHCCNKQAQRLHHQSYHEDDRLCVVPLCHSCHSKAHAKSLNATFGVVPTAVGLIRIAIATVLSVF